MRPAIEAVRATGTAVAEVALCYTGDLTSPGEKLYTLDYYLRLAEQIVDAGAHVIAIKDMAGLLRAPAARTLVTALRERFDQPVHLHTHDTAGGQLGTLLAAIDAGVDAVDVASAPMAGTTSQPSLSALVAATDGTDARHRARPRRPSTTSSPTGRPCASSTCPFESGLPSPTGRVYTHEIPGGQLSNLRQQAIALGLGDHFEEVEDMYAAANRILGNIVKVTPSSKVVGDLALALVGAEADPADFEANPTKYDIPDSVIGFLAGELGDPPGGWPEPFRTKALEGRSAQAAGHRADAGGQARRSQADAARAPSTGCSSPARPGSSRSPARPTATSPCSAPSSSCTASRSGESTRSTSSPASACSSALQSVGDADDRGMRTVMCTIDGQLRPVQVRDERSRSTSRPPRRPTRAPTGRSRRRSPASSRLAVAEGATVEAGAVVATIEAMKMEANITAPVGRHGAAARHRLAAAGGGRRPPPRGRLTRGPGRVRPVRQRARAEAVGAGRGRGAGRPRRSR